MTNTNLFSYILSLIGFGTSTETVTHIDQNEINSCSFLSSSTCLVDSFIQEETNEKSLTKKNLLNEGMVQNWLNQLSNAALCQILTSAITDYPQVADTIQSHYFGRTYVAKKGSDGWITELVALKNKAHRIAHSLDHCRISDQFSKASKVAVSLHLLLRQFTQDVSVHGRSHIALLGLILLAQESLNTPTEVRQQIFSHDKFGRVLTLEMASVLKNFKLPLLPNEDWYPISPQKENWIISLEQVCLKMARYDVTWEYRKEYQDVPTIAARYYKHYAH
ncbi:hypothetical protein BY458DRAFT_516679 [Sporodiniella umbellata]|nr:hypothetical protein BY458DRAFT_516679 [Sporodiniella umbellata]